MHSFILGGWGGVGGMDSSSLFGYISTSWQSSGLLLNIKRLPPAPPAICPAVRPRHQRGPQTSEMANFISIFSNACINRFSGGKQERLLNVPSPRLPSLLLSKCQQFAGQTTLSPLSFSAVAMAPLPAF